MGAIRAVLRFWSTLWTLVIGGTSTTFHTWVLSRRRRRIITDLLNLAEYENLIDTCGIEISDKNQRDLNEYFGQWRLDAVERATNAGIYRIAIAILTNKLDPVEWREGIHEVLRLITASRQSEIHWEIHWRCEQCPEVQAKLAEVEAAGDN
jgi:hypothetical protein